MLITALVATPGPLAAQDLDAPYAERIEHVDEWGRAHPGYLPALASPLNDLGLVAGIMMQTAWQRDSGRDVLSVWSRMNAGLSLQPYWLATEYERDGDLDCQEGGFVSRNPTRDPDRAPLTRQDVCQAWRTYFVASEIVRHWRADDHPVARGIAQRCLWDAHTKSIVHELWQHETELQEEALPEPERRFWTNWIGAVFFLADLNYPTTGTLNSLFSARLLPDCSPLGEGSCQLDRFSGSRYTFLALLTAEERSVQGLIDEFLLTRDGTPPCTAPYAAGETGRVP